MLTKGRVSGWTLNIKWTETVCMWSRSAVDVAPRWLDKTSAAFQTPWGNHILHTSKFSFCISVSYRFSLKHVSCICFTSLNMLTFHFNLHCSFTRARQTGPWDCSRQRRNCVPASTPLDANHFGQSIPSRNYKLRLYTYLITKSNKM